MTNMNITPNPNLVISEEGYYDLPLRSFDLLLVAEPDPETWLVNPKDEKRFYKRRKTILDMIDTEIGWEMEDDQGNPLNLQYDPQKPLAEDNQTIWIINYDAKVNYYDCCTTTGAQAMIPYLPGDTEVPEYLLLLLEVIKIKHPNWKVAVLGAMLEDEVIRIANASCEAGFSTTVISRYCFSARDFINMDDLFNPTRSLN
jgi:hypothetical protein